ncbi:MAG: potassium channel family protein [Halanaeroarchaeum sp.]
MVAFSLPFEFLRGVYLGILTGVLPALIAFAFGFVFRYVTGVTIPGFAVIVLALALAGVNGGLLAFVDPTITQSANSVALMTAVVVVTMLSLYTHSLGDRLATEVPHRFTLERLRATTVSADVVELVGGRGEVPVSVVGEVRDVEGYPPLPEPLRAELGDVQWRFPADLPLAELERRMAERYRTEFDLQDVDVAIDARGRASVAAAPPASGVSRRIERGKRAVSLDALVPTGVARGESVTVVTEEMSVDGTVVSASSGTAASGSSPTTEPAASDGEPADDASEPVGIAPTTTGGRGRITVAVDPADATALLEATRVRVIVTSRGSRREYELVSLLRRAGQRLRRVSIGSESRFDGTPLGDSALREEYGVAILALRAEGEWTVAPDPTTVLRGGTDVYAVGGREALRRFQEAAA